MSTGKADLSIKVLLIGDSGVGKSSLLLSFTSGAFDEDINATIGIDFRVKKVEVLDAHLGQRKQLSMQLWDTAGQERFRTLTSSYYRGANAVVLVYDVNEPQTFTGLQEWLEEANAYCRSERDEDSVIYLLIGNKVDRCPMEGDMAVSKATAQSFAKQHAMLFALTSAKTQVGVAQAFDEVARNVFDKLSEMESMQRGRGTTLRDEDLNSGGGGCC
ncbi:ras-related protein Rab-18-like [Bactrocera neohumeralis]|uniref:ras-related protein Rab-18-like n=1 Tax=Bactrocera neohumeralis TaxID=98809 RepID=UPI002165C559|nr:ras-related protein Rab-18-like [Bactrocera neohumeralis]